VGHNAYHVVWRWHVFVRKSNLYNFYIILYIIVKNSSPLQSAIPYQHHYSMSCITTAGHASLQQVMHHYSRSCITTACHASLQQVMHHYSRSCITTAGHASLQQVMHHYSRSCITTAGHYSRSWVNFSFDRLRTKWFKVSKTDQTNNQIRKVITVIIAHIEPSSSYRCSLRSGYKYPIVDYFCMLY